MQIIEKLRKLFKRQNAVNTSIAELRHVIKILERRAVDEHETVFYSTSNESGIGPEGKVKTQKGKIIDVTHFDLW